MATALPDSDRTIQPEAPIIDGFLEALQFVAGTSRLPEFVTTILETLPFAAGTFMLSRFSATEALGHLQGPLPQHLQLQEPPPHPRDPPHNTYSRTAPAGSPSLPGLKPANASQLAQEADYH